MPDKIPESPQRLFPKFLNLCLIVIDYNYSLFFCASSTIFSEMWAGTSS